MTTTVVITVTATVASLNQTVNSIAFTPTSTPVGSGRQSSTLLTTTSPAAHSTTTASIQTAPPQSQDLHEHRKHVIIGSLFGTVAGLLLIGLVACLLLWFRRRRLWQDAGQSQPFHDKGSGSGLIVRWASRRAQAPDHSQNFTEKESTSGLIVRWASKVAGIAPAASHHFATPRKRKDHNLESTASSYLAVDEDHHIIRMSLRHWPRPFVRDESYRDSLPPGVLRVTNPDRTLPPTPYDSLENLGGPAAGPRTSNASLRSFFRIPRAAFENDTGAGDGPYGIPRSRASSRSFLSLAFGSHAHLRQHPLAQEVPQVVFDSSSSVDRVAAALTGRENGHGDHAHIGAGESTSRPGTANSRFFTSRPSLSSLRAVVQRPPRAQRPPRIRREPRESFIFSARSRNFGYNTKTSRAEPGAATTQRAKENVPVPQMSAVTGIHATRRVTPEQVATSRLRQSSLSSVDDSAPIRAGNLLTHHFQRSQLPPAMRRNAASASTGDLSKILEEKESTGGTTLLARTDTARRRAKSHGNYDLLPAMQKNASEQVGHDQTPVAPNLSDNEQKHVAGLNSGHPRGQAAISPERSERFSHGDAAMPIVKARTSADSEATVQRHDSTVGESGLGRTAATRPNDGTEKHHVPAKENGQLELPSLSPIDVSTANAEAMWSSPQKCDSTAVAADIALPPSPQTISAII